MLVFIGFPENRVFSSEIRVLSIRGAKMSKKEVILAPFSAQNRTKTYPKTKSEKASEKRGVKVKFYGSMGSARRNAQVCRGGKGGVKIYRKTQNLQDPELCAE